MSNTNSRFKLLGQGIMTEMIAHQTQLIYEPSTQKIEALFVGSPYLKIDDKYVPVGNEVDTLKVDLTSRMIEVPGKIGDRDPVTGVDLSNVSVAGIAVLLKRSYDNYHNERDAMREAEKRAIANGDSSAYPTNGTEYTFGGIAPQQ